VPVARGPVEARLRVDCAEAFKSGLGCWWPRGPDGGWPGLLELFHEEAEA